MRHRAPARRLALLVSIGLALHAASGRAGAQAPAPFLRDFMHEKWNTEDGLTPPAVQTVVRTRDGYLWLGSARGLLRFDGQRFRSVNAEAGVDGRLATASITALAEDGEGALWIGTADSGVARLRGASVDWFGGVEGLPSLTVRCLFIDRTGQVWVGTARGLVWFKDRVFVSVPEHAATVNAIAEDAAGDMWIGTSTGTMVVERGVLVPRRAAGGGVDAIVSALLRDRDGRLWAGTGAGLFAAAPGRPLAARREFGPRWVTSLGGDRDGRIWAGTSGDGLFVVDGVAAPRRLGVDEGLSQEAVTALHVDADGSVWVATPDGLDRVRPRLLRTASAPGPARLTWAVSPDDAAGVWVGTNRGLARAQADPLVATAVAGIGQRTVRDVLTTRDGSTWVAVDETLFRIAPGRAPQQAPPPARSIWGRVRALFEDRDGVLWVGATLAGLVRRDGSGAFVSQPFAEERDPSRIWTITQDDRGALWVGGHGLHRLAGGRWTTFSRETGLPTDDVMAILADGDRIWLGGYNEGLTLLSGDRVTVFRQFNSDISPQAYAIVDDGRGYLWVSSSYGLQRLSKSDLLESADGGRRQIEVRSFDKLDGLLSPEFNGAGAHAGARTRAGLLWFANSSGAVVVNPARIDTPPPLAPVRIETVAADDVPAPVHGGDIELVRGRGRQRLEFQFSSPSLLTPRRVRFRYRLENFDRDWVDSGVRRTATYTGLPGGRYRFRVQAYYAGRPPDAASETTLTVGLPRYVTETAAFLVSLPLALIAAGYGFHLLRVRRLRRQARELSRVVDERTQALRVAQANLEERVQERTAQLEAELGERKRVESQLVQAQKLDSIGRLAGGIAHDLNNLLTAILGYASLAEQGSTDDMREDVRQITAAGERAARLTQQLLAFARRQVTEPRNLSPNVVVRDLEPMLRRLIGEDMELSCTLPDDPWTIRADANQIQQVLVNLVINARDAMPDGGRVTITASNEPAALPTGVPLDMPGDRVVIAVADTGVGISDEVKAHLFEPFFTTKPAGKGTGLGLATSYGIVTQAGGRIDIESTVGQGTTVRVSLPRIAAAPDAGDDASRASLPAAVTDRRTLLLAEDEVLVRAMASRVLRDLGHQVLEAVDGEDALDVAARHQGSLDLLVTDLVMPRMGGLDLAARLRARHPGLRVVFMSGYAERAVAARVPPGAPMLHKPFTPAVLAQRVQDVLAADVVQR